jgi:hypothetical protein
MGGPMLASNGGGQVFVLVEIDKITDVPAPLDGGLGEVMLTLERASGGQPIGRPSGPFRMEAQGELRQALNVQGKLTARVSIEDLGQDTMELRVVAYYHGPQPMPIGAAPISVSWKPVGLKYTELQEQTYKPVGGIYLAYRWVQEADLQRSMIKPIASPRGKGKGKGGESPRGVGDISGVSGKFKHGGQDEVFEAAALAVEAQNRALKQRQHLATQYETVVSDDQQTKQGSVWEGPNGYRDWSNLDSVFITMGPNYVAQSGETGANICRVYNEETSVWKELRNKAYLQPVNPLDEQCARDLVSTLYKDNPDTVMTTLRPVLCKDVSSIERGGIRDARDKPILHIKIWNAQHLRTKAGFMHGAVTPKVIVEIPGKPASKWETKPTRDGRHVEWNEEAVISGYTYGDSLKITVADKAFLGFGGETHLGEGRLSGADFYPDSFHAALRLSGAGPHGNTTGNKGPGGNSSQLATLMLEVRVEDPIGGVNNWPPAPPMYAPVENLNASDRETQRLANWDPHQICKLPFADVNPNYQMNEDIWGAMSDGKAVNHGTLMSKPPDWRQPRVKDGCPMA